MAYRFLKPLTSVGTLENFWLNASEILCAGSVDIIRTVSLDSANSDARQQLGRRRTKIF